MRWKGCRAQAGPVGEEKNMEIAFSPIALQAITILRPGKVKEWAWEQEDNEGEPVLPGAHHTVKPMTVNPGMLLTTSRIE